MLYYFALLFNIQSSKSATISVLTATTESFDANVYQTKALIETMEQLSRRGVKIFKLFACYSNLDFELWLYWNDETVVACEILAVLNSTMTKHSCV